MNCRINFQSDPISLNIIAADGKEHLILDAIGDGNFVEVEIRPLLVQTNKEN